MAGGAQVGAGSSGCWEAAGGGSKTGIGANTRGVGVSHILGLGMCMNAGVTGGHAPWDAKSCVDRLFLLLASMYLTF